MMAANVSAATKMETPGAYLPEIENIQRRADGTYVIAYGGAPYHATEDVTPDVYDRVLTEIEGGAVVTEYVEPEAPKADPLAEAVAEYNRLRGVTDFVIAPLQDAVDVGEATETEFAALNAWKKYRVALSRVPDQQGYPLSIDWPAAPV
ncbi:tail fiber assembly protein [Pseudomonas shahriarae]|uniref:tail fiber assembly protein n=1 Tax=Pseudomonas shahriarae TaxID=2745512 RepID=UPI00235FB570|nr:tail fiber assembly protein [Pseudomonas shahriarae]